LSRKEFKKEDFRHYVLYLPTNESLKQIKKSELSTIHDTYWGIENFHIQSNKTSV